MKRTKSTLKSYFETGDKPTQTQYEHLIDSFRHLDDKIPLTDLEEEVTKKPEFLEFSINAALKDQNNRFTNTNSFDSVVNFYEGDGNDSRGVFFYDHSELALKLYTAQGASSLDGKLLLREDGVYQQAATRNWVTNSALNEVAFTNTDNQFDKQSFQTIYTTGSNNSIWMFDRLNSGNSVRYNLAGNNFAFAFRDESPFTDYPLFNLNTSDKSATFYGNISIPTNKHLYSGDNQDLHLWHSSNGHSYIDNYTGNLYLNNKEYGADIHIVTKDDVGNVHYGVSVLGTEKNVYLRYDNLTRLTTTNDGIDITGDIQPSGNYISSDGTPGYNGNFTVGVYDITVKDGLITNVVNIS